MLPFTLRQLTYIVTVADTGHFGRAAALCGVSQPSLSAQVALVEDLLGRQVFERGPGGTRVARRAEAFVDAARRLLRDADALARLGRGAGPFEGDLRLGVIPTVAPYVLPLVSGPLRTAYPGLSVYWTEDRTEHLVRQVEMGAMDAAFLALEADLGGLVATPVVREPFVVAVGADHPLAGQARVADAAALDGEPLLVLTDGHCLGAQTLAACRRPGVEDRERAAYRATSLATLLALVAGGLGVTLLPALAGPVETRHPGLRTLPFAGDGPGRTLGFVRREGSPFEATLAGLGETLAEVLGPRLATTTATVDSKARRTSRSR